MYLLALISVLAVQQRADSGPLPSADNPQQLPQRLPAFTQQQQQRMQAFQMPQPAATFSYPMPAAQSQQQTMYGYQPTASLAAIAAANQGFNNMRW